MKGKIWTFEDVEPADISGLKMEYLKGRINERVANSKNKNNREPYRLIKEFKRDYQLISKLLKNKISNPLPHIHNISNMWTNYPPS
jgi:hypothetical protein